MKQQRDETLRRYLAACESLRTSDIVACFAEGARVKDPMGSLVGKSDIRGYFDKIYAELADLAFEVGPVSWCGDACAVPWKGRARRHDQTRLTYEGIDVFTFDSAGLIAELWAFWTPEDLADNIG